MPPILVEGDAMARFFLDSLLSFDGGVRGGRISPLHLFIYSLLHLAFAANLSITPVSNRLEGRDNDFMI